MDEERTGERLPPKETKLNLAGILAEYFENFDITHPGPLPPLRERIRICGALKRPCPPLLSDSGKR